jgi:multidrug efflux pump subunit AcrA (membrane-fusion protein)
VVLPAAALSSLEGQAAVWLLDEQRRVQLRPVRVARYGDGWMVVDSGLQAGQQVVVAGGQLLYPGQMVEIAESYDGATELVP